MVLEYIISTSPDKTAEWHRSITYTGHKISAVVRMAWRKNILNSEIWKCTAAFSTRNEQNGKTGSVSPHMKSGQSLRDLELNQNPVWIRSPYFIIFSIISLLFTATSTTMQRLNSPAWLCLKMASELRGLSLGFVCAGNEGRSVCLVLLPFMVSCGSPLPLAVISYVLSLSLFVLWPWLSSVVIELVLAEQWKWLSLFLSLLLLCDLCRRPSCLLSISEVDWGITEILSEMFGSVSNYFKGRVDFCTRIPRLHHANLRAYACHVKSK